MDTTEKLGLNLPEKGYENWGVPLNENFEKLDTAVGNLEEVIDTKVAALETKVNEEIGVAVEGLQGEVSNLSEQTAKLAGNNTFTGSNAFTKVVTSTAQPINFVAQNNTIEKGVTPTVDQYCGYEFRGKDGVRLAYLGIHYDSDGSKFLDLQRLDTNLTYLCIHYPIRTLTPDASENSTIVPTTAWVRANLGIEVSYED